MSILNNYINLELEARILVTNRFLSERDKGRNNTEDKETTVHLKKEAFLGINYNLNIRKKNNEELTEKKMESIKQPLIVNEDVKMFMEQLEGLKNVSKPESISLEYKEPNNKHFKPRNEQPPFSPRDFPYEPAQNILKPYLKCGYFLEEGNSFNK
ncbi:hypothetical protein O181_012614 [Austropuccinia psidii MF-1]|uniref:Uncharacterized protein n=1 Tax=Austropuccinia psidii MF-1 TaxID=1389203 RepID=A0A9Q3GN14_9BASI|nr:hypothetical protein [Austropuccinia psidii MF-1]